MQSLKVGALIIGGAYLHTEDGVALYYENGDAVDVMMTTIPANCVIVRQS
ncbi:MAG: hypothetical protein IKL68_06210 [Clostridia bacterium]|nr:hypothetical protein [Clostridia bacterium]